MKEPQPLRHNLAGEKIDTSRVAARPGEAGDKTKPDRVLAETEDNGGRRRWINRRVCLSVMAFDFAFANY
jgi:hypothetical protein